MRKNYKEMPTSVNAWKCFNNPSYSFIINLDVGIPSTHEQIPFSMPINPIGSYEVAQLLLRMMNFNLLTNLEFFQFDGLVMD